MKTTGQLDIIGLDIFKLQTPVETLEEAIEVLKEAAGESVSLANVEGQSFLIRSMVSDVNRLTTVLPEDLEPKEAIQLQVKISEILREQGINVNLDEEKMAEIEKGFEEAEEEAESEKSN
ncbi:MAG: hypothetical protein WC136_00310 [Sphaerochaeta sp.]|jgi:hypothetical protein